MSFLYPAFLYGLLFLAVPIIIHFFNFQRPRRVYFTNIGFLKQIKTDTNAKNKLKHLLVLLARLAFITALVFAFAQPIWHQRTQTNSDSKSPYASIYIDNSWSMSNTINDLSLLDKAATYFESLTTALDYGVKFQVLDNGMNRGVQGFYDRENLDFDKTYMGLGLPAEVIQARQIESFERQSSPNNNTIFWLSDFQKSTFNLENLTPNPNQNYYILPLVGDTKENLYIDSVWLNKPFIRDKENAICYVQLHNRSPNAFNNITLKLLIEDKEVSNQTVNLKANTKSIIELNFVFNQAGNKRCTIVIEDYALDFDNRYFFILPSIPAIKIAHLSSKPQNFIANVYSEENFFDYVALDYNSLDYNSLKSFDLVIIDNLPDLNSTLGNEIYTLNQKGLDVVIFPHSDANLESYKQLLTQNIRALESSNKQALAPPDIQSPIFRDVLLKVQPDMTMPVAQPVWTWEGLNEDILNFKNGQPFLSLIRTNAAKVYLFASPLDLTFTDLPYHALFVPIMYKIAINSVELTGNLAQRMNAKAVVMNLKDLKRNQIVALRHANQRFIPNQRIIDNQLIFDIPNVSLEAGFYDLIDNATDSVLNYIAFNYAKEESLVEDVLPSLEAFAGKYENVSILDGDDENALLTSFKESQGYIALWGYCLGLALVFLLLEIVLIRFR